VGPDTATRHPVDRVPDEVAARFLRKFWDELVRRYAPEHVVLFGSRATGKARPDSDVDLIVVSTRFAEQRFIQRGTLLRQAIAPEGFGLPVHVLCYTPEEFEQMSTGIGMVAEAVKEGIWVR
jgi:predicted nucleotidyltransferase